jgi:hypothetical protein
MSYHKKSRSERIADREAFDAGCAEENRLAAEKALASGLAALVGSEKQVAWANTVRQTALDSIDRTIASIESSETWHRLFRSTQITRNGNIAMRPQDIDPARTSNREPYIRCLIAEKVRLESITSAKWFIDNRTSLGGSQACERADKRIIADCAGVDYQERMAESFSAVTLPTGGVL